MVALVAQCLKLTTKRETWASARLLEDQLRSKAMRCLMSAHSEGLLTLFKDLRSLDCFRTIYRVVRVVGRLDTMDPLQNEVVIGIPGVSEMRPSGMCRRSFVLSDVTMPASGSALGPFWAWLVLAICFIL